MSEHLARIRIRHLKLKPFHYLSQLDVARFWDRLIRRASLPIAFSQGFNPRPRISFGPALALGIQSYAEYVQLTFLRRLNPEEIFFQCSREMPHQMRPIEVMEPYPTAPGLTKSIRGIRYRFVFTGEPRGLTLCPQVPWAVEWDNPVLARRGFMLSCVFKEQDIQLSPIKFISFLQEEQAFPEPSETIKADVLFER